MIVKSKTWKSPDFKFMVNYILSDKGRSNDFLPVCQNISDWSVPGIVSSFQDNDVFRRKRRGGVCLYHEIMSFHPDDTSFLSHEILDDLILRYIALRGGDRAVVFAMPHMNESHFHVHFCFSATEFRSAKSVRKSKVEFARIKRTIEEYQLKRYPQLSKSLVYLSPAQMKKCRTHSEKEAHLKSRKVIKSDKEILVEKLNGIYHACDGFRGFCELLERQNFEVYSYRDKLNGVVYNGRKYRFSSLGFSAERFVLKEQRLEALSNTRKLAKLRVLQQQSLFSVKKVALNTRSFVNESVRNVSFRHSEMAYLLRNVSRYRPSGRVRR